MAYRLNPNLIEQKRQRDREFPYRDQHVFLCDPKNVGPEIFDVPIGEVVLREISEDTELADAFAGSQAAISAYCKEKPGRKPRVYRTTDCFGYSGDIPVILVVTSDHPIFVDMEAGE